MKLPNAMRAVVTGGGSGLGRGFCNQIAARGGKLIVADIDLAKAEETAKILGDRGTEAHAVKCDVSHAREVEGLAKMADDLWGGADLIVNNAGVATVGKVGEVPLDDWHWLMGINLYGVIYGCHAFVPRFKKQGSGHIVNVASAAGLLSAPNMGPYNVSKAGVVSLSETLYAELSPLGIGVTVLCPTFFKTGILDAARDHATNPKAKAFAQHQMDTSKLTADDVARIALDAAERDQLHVIPQADGRWFWRFKRLAPQRFQSGASSVDKLLGKITARRR
ncbi:MAG TPA: SDR family NAD(P)-dependent oxidoreductase [Polyangiaceae bacterium]